MKRATFVWASRLVAPLAFFLLGELVLVFPDTFRLGPWVLVIGIPLFSVVAWRLREDGWRRMLAGMFPVLVLVTLFWSRWWMGQLVLMFSFVGYAVVISRLHLPRVDPKELFRAAAFFYLFLVFLNFYIFQAQVPFSYGLILLGAVVATYFGVVHLFERGIAPLVLMVLVGELMFILHFLPQGYLALSAVSLIATYALSEVMRRQKITPLFLRTLVTLGISVVVILVSSGIRPR